jgi:hypothetical protein
VPNVNAKVRKRADFHKPALTIFKMFNLKYCTTKINIFPEILLSYRNQNLLQMRNKVDVRAFCVEQVVKASGVSDAKKVVDEAKVLEEYVIGDANLPEMDNELSEMKKFFQDTMDRLEENRKENSIRAQEDCIRALEIARSVPSEGVVGYCLKPNEA